MRTRAIEHHGARNQVEVEGMQLFHASEGKGFVNRSPIRHWLILVPYVLQHKIRSSLQLSCFVTLSNPHACANRGSYCPPRI